MRTDKVNYRNFITETSGKKDDMGFWSVTLTCTETDSVDGLAWEKETIRFMGIDKNFDDAHKVALRAYYAWMNEYAWQQGFSSLIDAVAYSRKSEKDAESNGNSDKSIETPTP